MYTPKLREDLVCALYRLKQVKKKPMTKLLNDAVELYTYSQNLSILSVLVSQLRKSE